MKSILIFSFILLVLFSISCNQNIESQVENKNVKKVKKNPKASSFECKYDSIVINKYDLIKRFESEKTDSFYIFKKEAIQLIQPYLEDSLINEYSCCNSELTGIMTVFSEGERCMSYSIGSSKGVERKNYDTISTFIVPLNYQSRIKVPDKIWRSIIKDVIRVKILEE